MNINNMKILLILSIFVTVIPVLSYSIAMASEIPRITKEDAKEMMDNPGVVFLDVRSGSDWRASDIKITGAVHEEPRNVEGWISKYDAEKTYILYCA